MDIAELLRNKGLRQTRVRKSILEILEQKKSPIPLATLQECLRKMQIKPDRTTLYRELRTLEQQRILHVLHHRSGAIFYEIIMKHHHHAICTQCDTIQEVELGNHLENIENKISKSGFHIESHELDFYGLCSECYSSTQNR